MSADPFARIGPDLATATTEDRAIELVDEVQEFMGWTDKEAAHLDVYELSFEELPVEHHAP